MPYSMPDQKRTPLGSFRRNRSVLPNTPENNEHRDALYLFACHIEWRTNQRPVEYEELLTAIDDHNGFIRALAEDLLSRRSIGPVHHTEIEAR
jgi:hypothetical protein